METNSFDAQTAFYYKNAEMKGFANYRIVLANFVKEVDLIQLGQIAVDHRDQAVSYAEKGKDKLLIIFLHRCDTKISGDGTHMIREFIPQAHFVRVDGYRRFLIFDHLEKTSYYNDNDKISDKNAHTYIFPVYNYPEHLAEFLAEIIGKYYGKKEL